MPLSGLASCRGVDVNALADDDSLEASAEPEEDAGSVVDRGEK